jgi:flagellar biosynthesis protein FlhA
MMPSKTILALWGATARGAILPIMTLAIVVLMIVPVPSIILDIGFIANIAISLAVLMIALNAAQPLEFSSFPTVLLFTTLLRLSLNVASTRVVLVAGHKGEAAAGHVIEAFGSFVIAGNWAVGIFVFLIVMIINLVVITKGAGRVSEVSARFTLDALPGKQMAIDADLNAGLMTPEQAKVRRQEVATEADFYGSMDGASKFVKGDAVAGVMILSINIIGGIVLGTLSHGLSLQDATKTYVLLAIGDALVAQVPALLLSIAAAAIVTRVSSPLDLAGQITTQFGKSSAWIPVAAILGFLGLLPGMPHLIVVSAALGTGALAWQLRKREKQEVVIIPALPAPPAHVIEWSDLQEEAVLSVEIGYALIGLVDERRGAPLMARITAIRRQLSRELGFVVPLVRVRDDMSLAPNVYRLTLSGIVVGEDEVFPDDFLALDSGDIETPVRGQAVKDPTFGLDAIWVSADLRSDAISAGYTVVDAPTVIATHLNRAIVIGAADLFGIDEAQKLVEALKESAPELAKGLTPLPFGLAAIAALCRSLLLEGVPLKDFRRIALAMIESAPLAATPRALHEAVRQRIGALIVQTIVPARMPLPAITLDPGLELLLAQALQIGPDAEYPFEPALSTRLVNAVNEAATPMMASARSFAIVTSPAARASLSRLLRPHFPETPVLSFLEIPDTKAVDVIAVVGAAGVAPAALTSNQGDDSWR